MSIQSFSHSFYPQLEPCDIFKQPLAYGFQRAVVPAITYAVGRANPDHVPNQDTYFMTLMCEFGKITKDFLKCLKDPGSLPETPLSGEIWEQILHSKQVDTCANPIQNPFLLPISHTKVSKAKTTASCPPTTLITSTKSSRQQRHQNTNQQIASKSTQTQTFAKTRPTRDLYTTGNRNPKIKAHR
jgi:hypothetical protein